ncbi:hypothetical protein GTO89_16240 [Heliobacterium gestii]|uniref:Uncharacterized protein n=1 Tax=Heliomicrobium gestii TaxID=2699 RepID=A0A845LGB6_HELGE|nr:hypothetical protein [Heliomicrobium gestii]MBM7868430.1 hypothetical protein [Heliomicrobium gestii]MZP44581.1 hypothetical protein [Heliomicrobium gestii]
MDYLYPGSPAYRPMMCDRLRAMVGEEMTAEVRHPDGMRSYTGRLVSVGDDYIELEMEDVRATAQADDGMATEVMAAAPGVADDGTSDFGMTDYGTSEYGMTDYRMQEYGTAEPVMAELAMDEQGFAEPVSAGEAMTNEAMTGDAVMAMAGDNVQAQQFFYPPYRVPYRYPYRYPYPYPYFGPGRFYRTFIPIFLLTSLLARPGY